MDNNQSKFLSNLKVIELAGVLAGPSVGMFLAELGAQVIKVEHPTNGGDITRTWRLSSEAQSKSISAYYASVNYGKTIVRKDLSKASDQDWLHNEVANSDIVISNFKRDSAKRFNVTFNDLKAINSKLIFAHLSGYGENDARPAFDVVLQAEAGFISMTGTNAKNLAKLPVALIDQTAGHLMKEAILLALIRRSTINEAQKISVNLFDAALSMLSNQATNYLMESHIPKPIGTYHPNIAPYGDVFKTKDGDHVIIAIGSESQFSHLCEILDMTFLMKSHKFSSNPARVNHREELHHILTDRFVQLMSDDFLQACKTRSVPAGKVNTVKQVLDLPRSQELIRDATIEGVKTRCITSTPFLFDV